MIHSVRGDIARINRPDGLERPLRDLPAWPGPAVSDDEGRFTLRGLSRGLMYPLVVDDPRFGLQAAMIRTDDGADRPAIGPLANAIDVEPGPDPKPIAIALQPAADLSGA